jgi:pre-mRNA-splicing factor RBM22/SLT11
MASIKRDENKQKWEETEFPLVCETCLGDNPYIRMTKEPHGKTCKICETPFTVFAWQAGTKGRWKRVEICQNCARTKNVCQVCIFDLQYGLPVGLRDKVLAEHGSSHAIAAVPQSDANRSWYRQQEARALEQGQGGMAVPGAAAHAKLQSMARMAPRYERNLPKLCSFFATGECNRGSNCPFRHEMPKDRNDPLSKQNTRDRFYGTSDPVAGKMVGRMKDRERKKEREAEANGETVDETSTTLYIGFDKYDLNYNKNQELPDITEMEVRDKFYSFGEIVSVKLLEGSRGIFVEYTSRAATELALNSMNRTELGGRKIFCDFARAAKRGEGAAGGFGGDGDFTNGEQGEVDSSINRAVLRPLAPPGASDEVQMPTAPKGFTPALARPPSTTAVRSGSSVIRPGISSAVPRPGGGAIRRPGRAGGAAPTPYYPSQDPTRLGSKASES